MRLIAPIACAFTLLLSTTASAQEPPPKIGPFVFDIHGTVPRFPEDINLASSRSAPNGAPLGIGDLPGSGVLVFTDHSPAVGATLELWIEDFGVIPVEVVHSSDRLCGLVVTDPVAHREKLLTWLRYMLKIKTKDQPQDRRSPVFFCADITELASYRRK